MGIELYEPAPILHDEARRERAVEASGALHISEDPDLRLIVEEARRSLGTAMAAVSIIYRDWQYLIVTAGLPVGPYSRRTSFCGHVINSTDPVFCVGDARLDMRFAQNPLVADDGLLRFYAGARLLDEQALPLGSLCVLDPRPRPPLAAGEAARLTALAGAVMHRLRDLRRADGFLRPSGT